MRPNQPLRVFLLLFIATLLGIAAYYFIYRPTGSRTGLFLKWYRAPEKYPEWSVNSGQRCGSAPFIIPTDGFIGFLWDDSFRPGHRHQGIDIFAGTKPGLTPVYAAYDGYLTRREDWKSSLIIRIPDDPLSPGRQVWTYYTHLADSNGNSFINTEFPPGTTEKPVSAGDLLGYQGNYSGDPANPVGVHLHFSIVNDDGSGTYLNELKIQNTIDPSPYFGIELNARLAGITPPVCP